MPMFKITAAARDVNSALEDALRAYYDYCACVRVASPAMRPSLLNLDETVVSIPTEPPVLRRLSIQARRFQMRGGANRDLFERLDVLTTASPLAASFIRNLGEAADRLREGDLDSALEALILNQDLAFFGCRSHHWRYPRYLVELGSMLIALDWPRRFLKYIESYCRKPSHAVEPLPGVSDPSRARVLLLARDAWPFFTEDQRWDPLLARSTWDVLLDYRRREFLQMLADMIGTIGRVKTVASWDLARAVRARNTLVHQGSYLRHHRLLGVLFDVYELVMRLRLAALTRRPDNPEAGFVDLAGEVERDFQELATGAYSRQSLRSLCEEGWGGLWSS